MRLDASRSRSLSAVIQAIATVDRDTRKAVRQQSQSVIGPEWRRGLAERAPNRMFFDRLVNNSAVSVSDRNVRMKAGSSRPKMFPRETEFGAYREAFEQYTTRKGQVKRRTKRQFFHFQKSGRVVIPTVKNMIPRIASLWVQTAYRTIIEKIERSV